VKLDAEQRLDLRSGSGRREVDVVRVRFDPKPRRLEPLPDTSIGRRRLAEALAEGGRCEPLVKQARGRILLRREQGSQSLDVTLSEGDCEVSGR
jgi:hypothetical protein